MSDAGLYAEPGRGYSSLYLFAGLLAAGFVLDLSLGGGIAHLIGWLVAAALVLGVDLLIIYAARATHSITLDADELRVGEEAIARGEIVGIEPGADRSLPALGWPVGLPRGAKGVTLRLADERDVAVATRFPERLAAALGVGRTADRERPSVRAASEDDLPRLAEIDERAEAVFHVAGYALPRLTVPDDARDEAKAIFVLGDPAVGFARVDEVDGDAHLAELSVLPSAMKQGIGSELLEHACTWAAEQGYGAMTLTTYADVPWNGPFYAGRGFVEVVDPSPLLAAIRAHEAEVGLDDVGRRVVMRRDLG